MKRAVVLLSGGLDSATTIAWAHREGFESYCLSVDYGQRHGAELAATKRIAARHGAAEHRIVEAPLIDLPKAKIVQLARSSESIPR